MNLVQGPERTDKNTTLVAIFVFACLNVRVMVSVSFNKGLIILQLSSLKPSENIILHLTCVRFTFLPLSILNIKEVQQIVSR